MRAPRLAPWLRAALGALLLSACTAHALPMHDLAHGQYSAFDEPAQLIILDAQAWRSLWSQRLQGPPPPVDFTREMVLGVALGERPTGGYGIRIESIEQQQGTLIVTVREHLPPQGAMLSQAFSRPYHFVRVPRVDAQVVFRLASGA